MATFVKRNVVALIALLAAVITGILVPPDRAYLAYFDYKTLTCLFCVLASVYALKNMKFFTFLACKIIVSFHTLRAAVLALVFVTFIGSMFIANDMALLTFLPLGYLVLKTADKREYMAITFILQNISANLGGMLTPFGNPQNLYLYGKFQIPTGEFLSIMAPPFALAILLITLCCCVFVKNEPLRLPHQTFHLPPARLALNLGLFALSIAIVFHGIPYWLGLVVVPGVLLITDRKALKRVDYPLLLTFVFFFIFAGNMGRIPAVRQALSCLMEKNTLLYGILSCQVISNVPSAILLSQFTENYPSLLLAVNIGGVGTLISSLASLITFREFTNHAPDKAGRYLGLFTLLNFGFLGVMTALALVLV